MFEGKKLQQLLFGKNCTIRGLNGAEGEQSFSLNAKEPKVKVYFDAKDGLLPQFLKKVLQLEEENESLKREVNNLRSVSFAKFKMLERHLGINEVSGEYVKAKKNKK